MRLLISALWRGARLTLATILISLPVYGTTFVVVSPDDSGPGTLRNAIAVAVNGDTINFDLEYPATIRLLSPLILSKSVTISGPGADKLAISGGASVGVFVISSGVEIDGLTIEQGSSTAGGCIYNSGNTNLIHVVVTQCDVGNQLGGGIFNGGIMLIASSSIDHNFAGGPGEVGQGGGIYNTTALGVPEGGLLQIINSNIVANGAIGEQAGQPCGGEPSGPITSCGIGGGIFNHLGTVTVSASTVENNDALVGSGIYDEGGTLDVVNTTISGNTGTLGGIGIEAGENDVVTILSSTISNNVFGLGFSGNKLTITNSTFAGNSSRGLTIVSPAQQAVLSFTTIANNGSGIYALYNAQANAATTILNSILSNNGGINCTFDFQGLGSLGHNLSDDATCAGPFYQQGDLNNLAPGLDPSGLRNNGGPTQTIALLPGSLAMDKVPLSFCTDGRGSPVRTDQRGDPRPEELACDMGAFEWFFSINSVVASRIYNLGDQLQSLTIPPPVKAGLTLETDAAATFVNRGDNKLATDELGLFVLSVDLLARLRVLTSQQASDLTTQAQVIIKQLTSGASATGQ